MADVEEEEGGEDEAEVEAEVAAVVETGTEIMKEMVLHREKTTVGRILLRHLPKMYFRNQKISSRTQNTLYIEGRKE